jgi:uncharacterized protein YchJ
MSFHSIIWPSTPRQLLASRYTAFMYRLPAYIMATTHPTNTDYYPPSQYHQWMKELIQPNRMFDNYDFIDISIVHNTPIDQPNINIDSEDMNDTEAYISFAVRLRNKQMTDNNNSNMPAQPTITTTIRERSHFLRDINDAGRWKYASGMISVS